MQYVGLETQKSRNNFRSLLLLALFPCLVVGLVFLFCFLYYFLLLKESPELDMMLMTTDLFISIAPYTLGAVFVWFMVAYFSNTSIIRSATGSKPLERKENKRVYNLVENLCMSQGMQMPKVNVIDDESLNAFASGINEKTYTVTLSSGIIAKLTDEELEGVIAHELSHIRNRDVRLLIVSIVFVGIFALIAQVGIQMIARMSLTSSSRKNEKGGGVIVVMLLAVVVAAIGYLLSTLMRFAISRKREYLADAGAAQMTKNPLALASALRKIAADPDIEAVTREDVAQLFIEHPGKHAKGFMSSLSGLFATHPPINKRIEILEQC